MATFMAIEATETSLMARIDTVHWRWNSLTRQDLDKVRGHLDSAETRISDVADTAATHNRTLTDLQRQVKILMAWSAEQKIGCAEIMCSVSAKLSTVYPRAWRLCGDLGGMKPPYLVPQFARNQNHD